MAVGVRVFIGNTVSAAVGIAPEAAGGEVIQKMKMVNPHSSRARKIPPMLTHLFQYRNNLNFIFHAGSKKNARARIAYTANKAEPSNQFDSPSAETNAVMITPDPRAINSKTLKINVKG